MGIKFFLTSSRKPICFECDAIISGIIIAIEVMKIIAKMMSNTSLIMFLPNLFLRWVQGAERPRKLHFLASLPLYSPVRITLGAG
jgi:hypothetical protein